MTLLQEVTMHHYQTAVGALCGFVFGVGLVVACDGTNRPLGPGMAGAAAAIEELVVTTVEAQDPTGVASVGCPTGSLPVSPSCQCDLVPGSARPSVVFGVLVAGDGAICACFDSSKATVRATCLRAEGSGTVRLGLLADETSKYRSAVEEYKRASSNGR